MSGDNPSNFPYVNPDLVEALQEAFPWEVPMASWTMDRVREYGGQQSVIAFLKRKLDEQSATVLKKKSKSA